jgi:HPt (histidine-containing phosphotransfer) domain-containing protein
MAAHSIKGAAANVGVPGVREAARRIEQQAKDGDLSAAGATLPLLAASFENTRESLAGVYWEGREQRRKPLFL